MALDLEHRLSRLPTATNPTGAKAIVAEVHRRRRRRRLVATATIAAALGLVWIGIRPGSADTVRPRGNGAVAPAVGVQAVAEGPAGPRPITSGATLAPGEAVVFRIATSGPGILTLATSEGEPIWPTTGQWRVDGGEHFVGSDRPLAWTPDVVRPGPHGVVATLCPEVDPGPCASASFAVQWSP